MAEARRFSPVSELGEVKVLVFYVFGLFLVAESNLYPIKSFYFDLFGVVVGITHSHQSFNLYV